ncbi:mpv17-like protein [Onthophagus taurus]|uniref:mpv17-like protein n=1 Tax=Onthophagus taurus TaxID=166361 RepID=UPI000C205F2B|nr:mpv17-like protein [Onthophagus taurus]
MSGLIRLLKSGLTNYPIITNAGIFGTMFVGAECINQTLSKKILTEKPKSYDFDCIQRCGIYGTLIQGPLMTVWYRWLDKTYASTAPKIVLRKMLMDQFLFTPLLYAIFYTSMSILECQENLFEELIHKFPKTFTVSCLFWLPVQALNFSLVPPLYRVIYMGIASFAWVTILCYIKSETVEKAPIKSSNN